MSKDFKPQAAVIVRLLFNLAQQKGITQNEIAEKTGFKQSHISRMFAGEYPPKLHHLLKVADAIGIYLEINDTKITIK